MRTRRGPSTSRLLPRSRISIDPHPPAFGRGGACRAGTGSPVPGEASAVMFPRRQEKSSLGRLGTLRLARPLAFPSRASCLSIPGRSESRSTGAVGAEGAERRIRCAAPLTSTSSTLSGQENHEPRESTVKPMIRSIHSSAGAGKPPHTPLIRHPDRPPGAEPKWPTAKVGGSRDKGARPPILSTQPEPPHGPQTWRFGMEESCSGGGAWSGGGAPRLGPDPSSLSGIDTGNTGESSDHRESG